MFDTDMQKEYVFCSYLLRLIPAEPTQMIDDVISVFVNVGVGKNDKANHIYDITQNLRDTARLVDGGRLSKSIALSNGVSYINIPQTSEKGNP